MAQVCHECHCKVICFTRSQTARANCSNLILLMLTACAIPTLMLTCISTAILAIAQQLIWQMAILLCGSQ